MSWRIQNVNLLIRQGSSSRSHFAVVLIPALEELFQRKALRITVNWTRMARIARSTLKKQRESTFLFGVPRWMKENRVVSSSGKSNITMEQWRNAANWAQPKVGGQKRIAVPLFTPQISRYCPGIEPPESWHLLTVARSLQLRNRYQHSYYFVARVFYINIQKSELLWLLRGWHTWFIFAEFPPVGLWPETGIGDGSFSLLSSVLQGKWSCHVICMLRILKIICGFRWSVVFRLDTNIYCWPVLVLKTLYMKWNRGVALLQIYVALTVDFVCASVIW